MRDPMLMDPNDSGPEEPQPPPKVCSKCSAVATCINWNRYPYAFPPDPFSSLCNVFECPVHGCFELRDDGTQCFDVPDTYVRGPNGERLFEI